MTTPDSKLPNDIRRWRRALDMTQPELAAALGVAPATISFWERGLSRYSRKHLLPKLADALGVEPEALGIPPDGSPLRRLRRALGMTQPELAKMVGVSVGAVSRWERGENQPNTDDMIVRIAAALGVDPKELGLRSYCGTTRSKSRKGEQS